jgi:hypothetical protein
MASAPGQGTVHLVDRVTFNFEQTVALPSNLHIGALIGRGGTAIAAFRNRTNAFLKFPQSQPGVVVVCGHKRKHVTCGVELLQQQIEYFHAFGQWLWGGFGPMHDDCLVQL